MNFFRLIALAAVCVSMGCSTTANLYPIDGPLAKKVPLPVLVARVDGIMGNTGNVFLTMPDGEALRGRWSSIAPQQVSQTFGTASGITRIGMATAWTQVYGHGFSVSNLPGVNRGEAMLTGTNGTLLQIEFFTGSGTANGNGVAKDNHGNIFKVIF